MAALGLVMLITIGLCHLLLVPLIDFGSWFLTVVWWPWLLLPIGLWLLAGRPADP